MKRHTAVLALALFGTPALAGAETMRMNMSKATPADKAFMASTKAMMKNMDVKPTGKPDQDFVRMMMPHHQGAIAMAKVELQYGKDPEMLKLAGDIVAAQDKEIAEMKAWLAKNGK